TERDDGFAREHVALRAAQTPAAGFGAAVRFEARGVALDEPAAEALEGGEVGKRETVRIVDAHRLRPVQRAHQHRRHVRLELAQRARVEGAVFDAELALPPRRLVKPQVALTPGAEYFQPAGAVQEAAGP